MTLLDIIIAILVIAWIGGYSFRLAPTVYDSHAVRQLRILHSRVLSQGQGIMRITEQYHFSEYSTTLWVENYKGTPDHFFVLSIWMISPFHSGQRESYDLTVKSFPMKHFPRISLMLQVMGILDGSSRYVHHENQHVAHIRICSALPDHGYSISQKVVSIA